MLLDSVMRHRSSCRRRWRTKATVNYDYDYYHVAW